MAALSVKTETEAKWFAVPASTVIDLILWMNYNKIYAQKAWKERLKA